MTKNEFVTQLKNKLSDLSQDDIQKSVDYYCEMIDDRVEDGLSEEEAVAAIGNIDDIAQQILMDIPLTKLVKAKVTPKRSMKWWEITLIIIGFPVWLPVLVAIISVIFSLIVSVASIIISLYAVVFSLFASALACLITAGTAFVSGSIVSGFLMTGTAFVCVGTAILLFLLFNELVKLIIKLFKLIIEKTKALFVKKGV